MYDKLCKWTVNLSLLLFIILTQFMCEIDLANIDGAYIFYKLIWSLVANSATKMKLPIGVIWKVLSEWVRDTVNKKGINYKGAYSIIYLQNKTWV